MNKKILLLALGFCLTMTAQTTTILGGGQLVVNEIMEQNTSTVTDPNGQYEDWFELYNNTANPISLDGLYATDNPAELLKWQFPDGLTIPAFGYLSVWADEDLTEEGLHADFKFSAAGESCILSYANGTIIENITFGQQMPDMGYARVPNGVGNFVIQAPTYNANNENLSVSEAGTFMVNLKSFPNPTTGLFQIQNFVTSIESVKVFDLNGKVLLEKSALDTNDYALDLSHLSTGYYVVNVNNKANIKVLKN